MARPGIFDQAKFDEICARVSTGESLRSVCRDEGFPAAPTIRLWVVMDTPKGVSAQYARAREAQMEAWSDEITEIADDGTNDWMTVKRGGEDVEVENKEVVNRSRLRVDTRKWLMSKIAPKKYAERIQAEVTGSDGGPIVVSWQPPAPPSAP